jgi:hypothetical protein
VGPWKNSASRNYSEDFIRIEFQTKNNFLIGGLSNPETPRIGRNFSRLVWETTVDGHCNLYQLSESIALKIGRFQFESLRERMTIDTVFTLVEEIPEQFLVSPDVSWSQNGILSSDRFNSLKRSKE